MRSCSLLSLLLIAACSGTTDLYGGSDIRLAITPEPGPAGAPAEMPEAVDAGPVVLPPAMVPDAGAPDAAPDAAPPTPPRCEDGTEDCDGDAANGCETDLGTDREHCGSCGRACAGDDCACEDGEFTVSCRPGRADCDGDANNGCEIDSDSDEQNCGGCARRCHTDGHDAITATCNAGRCELTCEFQIEIDCDFNPDNGCEAYLMTDPLNCGACGTVCENACRNGRCE